MYELLWVMNSMFAGSMVTRTSYTDGSERPSSRVQSLSSPILIASNPFAEFLFRPQTANPESWGHDSKKRIENVTLAVTFCQFYGPQHKTTTQPRGATQRRG